MSQFNIKDNTHQRFNPLTGEWLLVSPHRGKRPWQGQQEAVASSELPGYDATCYLCPGNERIGGIKNPKYDSPFVFTNDFSALLPDSAQGAIDSPLFKARSVRGECKVICFSPFHNQTLPVMPESEIEKVVKLWQDEYRELGTKPYINYVQIFENKGAVMGCSNPHPHCQIWAQETIPELVQKEDEHQLAYYKANGRPLLQDYLEQELVAGERIVCQNDHFVALVPFWAIWPFETIILPRKSKPSIVDLSDDETQSFAKILKLLTTKYDNLFNVSFPYSSGIHQAPTNGQDNAHWSWHMHFFPPLFRSATVKKFMVGYEMMAEPQRDITAEQSAEILKRCSEVHYTHHSKL